jgi:hypothetical protein
LSRQGGKPPQGPHPAAALRDALWAAYAAFFRPSGPEKSVPQRLPLDPARPRQERPPPSGKGVLGGRLRNPREVLLPSHRHAPARHWPSPPPERAAPPTRPGLVTSSLPSDKRTRINHALSCTQIRADAAPLLSTRGIYRAPCREPRRCRKVRPALGDGDRPPFSRRADPLDKEMRVHVSCPNRERSEGMDGARVLYRSLPTRGIGHPRVAGRS